MKVNIDDFRQRLRDYRTRAAAIAAAVDDPDTWFAPALRMLEDRNETLRWCAIRILGEIGDERAVAPLTALRDSGRHPVETADALRAITGRDPDAAAAAAQPAAATPGLTDEELFQAAVRDLPATVAGHLPHYSVTVSLPDGRSQDVFIDFARTDPDGRAIVYLWTACGAVEPAKYEAALKLNMIIPYGAIGIAQVEDDTCFAMVNTYLRETANPREIGFSLMTLAREGDTIEKALSRQG